MRSFIFLIIVSICMTPLYAIRVSIPNAEQTPGKRFELPIQVEDLTDQNVTHYEFSLMYNPSILTATGINRAETLTEPWQNPTINIAEGAFEVKADGSSALSGSGVLIKLQFTVNPLAPAGISIPLAFTYFKFNAGTPTAETSNGIFLVSQDTDPPIITAGPTIEAVTSNSVTVVWETDEPATSVVEYGLDENYDLKKSESELTQQHQIQLINLQPAATYSYRVKSTDGSGNGPTTSAGFTFSTSNVSLSFSHVAGDPGSTVAIPIHISEVSGVNITRIRATIRFNPDILTFLQTSTDECLTAFWRVPVYSVQSGEITFTLQGAIPLNGSGNLIQVVFQVNPDARIGSKSTLTFYQATLNDGTIQMSLNNGELTVRDTRPPQIIIAPFVDKITSSSGLIRWQTAEKATSIIEYGRDVNQYEFFKESQALVEDHWMLINGLQPDIRYYFRVLSYDSSGNGPTESEAISFKTSNEARFKAEVSSFNVQSLTKVTIPIKFQNAPGSDINRWFAAIKFDPQILAVNAISIEGTICRNWPKPQFEVAGDLILIQASGGTYLKESGVLLNISFDIRRQPQSSRFSELELKHFFLNNGFPLVTTVNGRLTFEVNIDKSAPKIIFGPIVDNISASMVSVFWITDKPATSQVQYGLDRFYGNSVHNNALVTEHLVNVENLTPRTTYHFIAVSAGQYGNEPVNSRDATFQTISGNPIRLEIANKNVPGGTVFELPIKLKQPGTHLIKNFEFTIKYDPQILLAGKVITKGTLTAAWGTPTVVQQQGQLQVKMMGNSALTDSGTVAKIQFEAFANRPIGDLATVYFTDATTNSGTVPTVYFHGLVRIIDGILPQIVSEPEIYLLTPTSALIFWETDEPSTGTITYGDGAMSEIKSDLLEQGHLFHLSNLKPNTIYNFSVSSSDAWGNGPVQSLENTFQTQNRAPFVISLPDFGYDVGQQFYLPIKIYGPSAANPIYTADFTLKYDPGILQYNNVTSIGTLTRDWEIVTDQLTDSTLHIHLSGNWRLTKEGILINVQMNPYNPNRYQQKTELRLFNVTINDSPFGVEVLNGFFTLEESSNPKIIFGPGINQLQKNAARIYWVTNKPANSQIEYGLTAEYGLSLTKNEPVTYHTIDLFGLQPATTYHFKVTSTGQNNAGTVSSKDRSFQTSSGNEIHVRVPDTTLAIGKSFTLPIKVDNLVGKNVRQFSFKIVSDSALLSPGSIHRENTLIKSWELAIHQLTPSLIAGTATGATPLTGGGNLFEIQGLTQTDAIPNTTTPIMLEEFSFNFGLNPGRTQNGLMTLIDYTPPQFTSLPRLIRSYDKFAIIEWETDEPTTAIVEYGPDSLIEKRRVLDWPLKKQTITLTYLIPGAIYAYRVGITDKYGNGPFWSDIDYFKAQGQPAYLKIPELKLGIGELHDVPIFIQGLNGESLTQYAFTLTFDGTKMVPIGVKTKNTLTENWNPPEFSTGIEHISVAQNSETAISKDGVLAWISFMAHPKASESDDGWLAFSRITTDANLDTIYSDTSRVILRSAPAFKEVQIMLPDTTLPPGNWCQLPLRVSSLTKRAIFITQFELEFNPLLVSCGGVIRAGDLIGEDATIREEIHKNRLRVSINSPTQLSGDGTMLRMLFRIRPEARSGQTSAFKWKNFQFNADQPPTITQDGSLTLHHWGDIIMGYVTERDSLKPIEGASVRLTGEINGTSQTTTTDKIGRFIFAGLDSATHETYSITVTKEGYEQAKPLKNIAVGLSAVRIVLYRPDGIIRGKITTPTGFPIYNAQVIAKAAQGTGTGTYAMGYSDKKGQFQLENLNRVSPFRVIIQKEGFKILTLQQIYPDSSLWCVPDAYYSRITGMVSSPTDSNLSTILISLVNNELEAVYDSVRADVYGQFRFDNVVVGMYSVQATKPGFLLSDSAEVVTVEPSQNYHANLHLVPAVLDHFEIGGPELLPNGQRTRFRYQAWSTTGEKMELTAPPQWKVIPTNAGFYNNSGLFIPDSTYFGDTQIVLTAPDGLKRDSLEVVVYAPLSANTTIRLDNRRGITLDIPAGAVLTDTLIYLQPENMPTSEPSVHAWKTAGKAFGLRPFQLQFQQPLTLTMPVQTHANVQALQFGWWDETSSAWKTVPESYLNPFGLFQAQIYQGGLFAQLYSTEELGLHDIQLIPNPFSPEVDTDGDGTPGLAIHFIATSSKAAYPLLTVKIYNLVGDLVRELLVKEPVEKVLSQIINWDGLTDHQLKARNGRYILRMIIEEPGGEREYLKSIVLVK